MNTLKNRTESDLRFLHKIVNGYISCPDLKKSFQCQYQENSTSQHNLKNVLRHLLTYKELKTVVDPETLRTAYFGQFYSVMSYGILASPESFFSKEELEEFHSFKPKLVSDITSLQPYNKVPYLTSKVESMLNYNLTGGNIASGLTSIYIYKMMCKPEDRSPENLDLAIVMGWCIRFYEVEVIILDDVIDSAPIRYGRPSWPELDKDAALHVMFIESCMHYILTKYLCKHPQYKNIRETILKVTFRLNYAQILDSIPYNEDNLTEEFFETCSYGKFQHSTFYLTFSLAMFLANIQDPLLQKKIVNIALKMGRWLHIQNDYLDAFDNPRSRSIGKDIQLSKISWLAINAFHKSSPAQKKLFRENYGKDCQNSVNKIINLYKELRLPELYEETERKLQREILKDIENIPSDIIPHETFFRPMNNMKKG